MYQVGTLSKHNFRQEANLVQSNHIYFARTAEIGQGLGRILSCGARKPEQT